MLLVLRDRECPLPFQLPEKVKVILNSAVYNLSAGSLSSLIPQNPQVILEVSYPSCMHVDYCSCPQTLWLYCCLPWEGGHGWPFAVGGKDRSSSTSYETTALMFLQMFFLGNSGLVHTACCTFRTTELLNSRTRRVNVERKCNGKCDPGGYLLLCTWILTWHQGGFIFCLSTCRAIAGRFRRLE